tara:strand:+ start:32034 stop:32957 length:924 start_codon:yes stop_codon:yes gene_type:complete
VLAEGLAIFLLSAGAGVVAAILAHTIAAVVATAVGSSHGCYRGLLLCVAWFVPILGPLLGPLLVREPRAGTLNAHALFESYEAEVSAEMPLDRKAGADPSRGAAMSFHEVLQHGSIDHRRNALRKLAELGGRSHLELLRRCLSHPNMEIRLAAFNELNRLLRIRDRHLTQLRDLAEMHAHEVGAQVTLARAYRKYAASGLLDTAMARFQLQQAIQVCRKALRRHRQDPDLCVELAWNALELGDLRTVNRTLRRFEPDDAHPELVVLRARVAFVQRRFDDARYYARELTAGGHTMPSWLDALAVGGAS